MLISTDHNQNPQKCGLLAPAYSVGSGYFLYTIIFSKVLPGCFDRFFQKEKDKVAFLLLKNF